MSHEPIAIGVGQVAAIVIAISGLGALVREMDRSFEQTRGQMNRSFEEIARTNRVIAALIVQESEKIQTLLRA